MKKYAFFWLFAGAFTLLSTSFYWEPAQHRCPQDSPEWGFFGHKRINRLAVMTLPPEMMVFFKPNIDYLADHAVDPDMRRYAVNWEAPRHYIDLDEYGDRPDLLPKTWLEALSTYAQVRGVLAPGDTMVLYAKAQTPDSLHRAWKSYIAKEVLFRFSLEDKSLPLDSLYAFAEKNKIDIPRLQSAHFTENLSAHGILPWNLQQMQKRLTNAFREKDTRMILKLCADIGHYIGDAHVPLHTTSNYNGQKTNQIGIHGFWESRIPELFADEQYDFLVGKPTYVDDPVTYYWNITLESHRLVDSVLNIEWMLRKQFPPDRQMCPDIRSGVQVLAQCREFAAAYQDNMRGMVERRMRQAIQSVASVWYSAWLDAGAPDLGKTEIPIATAKDQEEEAETRQKFGLGRMLGRPEEH